MKNKSIRHILGVSGGKDSAALALYLKEKYAEIDMEYYFSDTGKELAETYQYLDKIEGLLGKKIIKLEKHKGSHKEPFDHVLDEYGGYLPSTMSRWCTQKLKLEPFEEFVGDDPVISYVAIRGDEDREGYVSTKPNIQTIFPFRKIIWSVDVLNLFFHNENILKTSLIYSDVADNKYHKRGLEIINKPQSAGYQFSQKINELIDHDIISFNKAIFAFLQTTNYPLSTGSDFHIINNIDTIGLEDVKKILIDQGLGLPPYTKEFEFEINGNKGRYNRTRSGCYFCFYQRKIEWIWLYERHPDLYQKAMEYEKDGYTWSEEESLQDLIKPERIIQIKEDHLKKVELDGKVKSSKLLIDILDDDAINCVNCFV